MSNLKGDESAFGVAAGSAPRFFWKQCYEIDEEEVHWALCDTESEKAGKCSCAYMVLLADYPRQSTGSQSESRTCQP